MQRQARYVWPAVALTALLGLLLLEVMDVLSTSSSIESYRQSVLNHPIFSAFYGEDEESDYLPADPYNAPGNLVFDPSQPLEADWWPLDQSLPSPVNWLRIIKDAISNSGPPVTAPPNSHDGSDSPSKVFAAAEEHVGGRGSSHVFGRHSRTHRHKHQHHHHVGHSPQASSPHALLEPFRETTLLIIGDSVDRGSLKYMAENLGLGFGIAQWENAHDTEHWKYLDNGVDPAYLPHQLRLPEPIDALITNCFMFGLDDKRDLLDTSADTKIDRAEDRIEKLCKPYTEQLKYPVSAISLQSGLWDLAYFGRRSVASDISTSTPLTREDLDWWLARMETLYKSIEQAWPGVPIVMRKMQRASAVGAEARYWHKNPGATQAFQNFFSDIRVHQIRNMQEYFAQQHGLEIHDFGLHFEGYQENFSDDVHPKNVPGGVVHNKAFLHYMHRALLSTRRNDLDHA